MHTMRRYPEKRAAFQRQRGADGKKIFHPFVGLESAMREQPVISNADSQASGNPPKQESGEKAFPGEHEERGNRAYMECAHKKSSELADRLTKCSVTLEKIHG
jgi:hypothetical protein